MKKIMRLFIGCFIAFFMASSFASTSHMFDIKAASAQLAVNPGEHMKSLHAYIDKVEALQDDAKECVSKSDEQLKVINELLKETQLESALKLSQADHQYFQNKKMFYAKQRSECRLFIYRSKEALLHYKGVIQKLNAYKILKRSTPIWKIHKKEVLLSLKQISGKKIISASGIKPIGWTQFFVGLTLLVLGVLIAIYIRISCLRWISKNSNAHTSVVSFVVLSSTFVIPIAFFGIIGIFLQAAFSNGFTSSLPELINHAILIFIGLFAASKYLFYPPRDLPSFINMPPSLGQSFHRRVVALLSWLFVGYLAAVIFEGQALSQELIELSRSLFITVLSALTVWFFWLLCKIPRLNRFNHSGIFLIKSVLSILLFIMLLTEWFGYHQLAVFIIFGVILTTVLLGVTITLWRFVDILYQWIDNNKYISARKIRQIFGVKPHRKLNEILLIKFSVYVTLVCVFFVGLMRIWSIPVSVIDAVEDALLTGFTISGLTIIPLRILIALVSFALIFLVGRLISAIVKRQHFKGEADTQVAVASIILYVAFAVALLFALLTMGVNFTGLAIIAGALSVGVGLGLQTIVNNFVSGIILLLEKPVKSGDRVIVGDTEGFIKKIRIRSTQITTLAKEDVIVPNADLITNQVTNYMFRDHFWRVVCKVGVAYGSDINLVKKVLLEVASKHPDVIQEAPNEPMVLFRDFGESGLLFELWSIIPNVNKKFIVESDLNFAIDAAFRQHGITIAFPQRDIHIKENIVLQKA